MFWKSHSWKAITCCVSKGMLVLLAIVSGIGIFMAGLAYSAHRGEQKRAAHRIHCTELAEKQDWARWKEECEGKEPPLWPLAVLGGIAAFGLGTLVLYAICSDQISYCQAAVDTGRKPWYWITDPLPPREMKKCTSCGSEKPETEAQYRTRLGLPPLEDKNAG